MTKKVLHLINGEHFAGAERVQDLLALRLPEFGYECDFVTLKKGKFKDYRKSQGVLEEIPMESKFDLSVSKRIIEFAKDKEYALVHTHTPRSALIGKKVARGLNIPLIHHLHSPTQRDTESFIRNAMNSFIEDRLVLPGADHIIPVSFSLKDYLLEHGVPEYKITPIPNGVPIVRDEVSWIPPEEKWVIGTVALFRPRKGLEVLLKAIANLVERKHPVILKAVGTFETPEYESSIKALARDLKIEEHIEWSGFKQDVLSEMDTMHVFVLPSLFGEGLPMVVIEAMSVGTPVVSTFVEGIPDVLDQGKAGVIVEPNNVDALASGIELYLNAEKDPRLTAQLAHRRQANIFSDTAMSKSVAECYTKILSL